MTSNKMREKIAQILGEKDIHELDNRWLELMEKGVVINLHVGGWRAKSNLTFDDLGLPEPREKEDREVKEQLLLLGQKFLLPANRVREIESAESAARKYLVRESLRTAYGPFVPFTKYLEVRQELDRYKGKYLGLWEDIVENIDIITQAHLATCDKAAREAYKRMRRLAPKAKAYESVITEEDFVTRFKDSITASIPNTERLRASVYFNIDVSYVPLPSLIAKDMAEAERTKAEGRVEAARIDAERERVEAQRKIERLKEDEAVSVEEQALHIREIKLEAMNRDVLLEARAKKEAQVDAFMKDMVSQLRSMVYEATTDVLASMEKNPTGGIHNKSVERLENLVQQIGSLNFVGDVEIEQMINSMRSKLALRGEQGGSKDVKECLRGIALLTRASLIEIGETPRSARSLGVPDVFPIGEIRQARESLGLAALEDVEVMGGRTGRRQQKEADLYVE